MKTVIAALIISMSLIALAYVNNSDYSAAVEIEMNYCDLVKHGYHENYKELDCDDDLIKNKFKDDN